LNIDGIYRCNSVARDQQRRSSTGVGICTTLGRRYTTSQYVIFKNVFVKISTVVVENAKQTAATRQYYVSVILNRESVHLILLDDD
jgi:ribosomal protein L37AE/L43A